MMLHTKYGEINIVWALLRVNFYILILKHNFSIVGKCIMAKSSFGHIQKSTEESHPGPRRSTQEGVAYILNIPLIFS